MEEISFVVPEWMSWFSLPILVIALLVLDYCTAIWLQPMHVPTFKAGTDATIKEIFLQLTIFSLIGAFFGLIASVTDVSFGRAILVELVFLAFFLWVILPKKLWLVAAVCYEAAFLVGEIAINYNAVLAGLMMVGIVITILILTITIGPLNSIKTK
ncbi:MAG: hypothetical protein KBC62_01885 [Candidatus Pacebacteria bacterium]|nr:hypothetical protein [Candidatus Paceibacterota bacterium]MBP9842732.1 hypothetical protein [Candidatus Paceibacterota bacterium]